MALKGTTAQEASDITLTGYEKPKDQGQKAKATRGILCRRVL